MKTSRLILSALILATGLATIASAAGAGSVLTDPTVANAAVTSCGIGTAAAVPLNLDLIPSKPPAGHQSVRGVGDDEDGCGEGTELDGRGSDHSEGTGGSDD
jgi:hypothetical protein